MQSRGTHSAQSRNGYWLALLTCSCLTACGLWSKDGEGPLGAGTAGATSSGGSGSASAAGGKDAGPVSGGIGAQGGNDFGGALGGDGCVPGVPVTSQIPRLSNRQYVAVMRDLLGVTTVPSEGSAGDQPLSDLLVADFTGPMTAPAWTVYQDLASKIAHEVMTGPNKTKFISCDPAATGCLNDTIKSFGRRAFRRPLSEAELARFQKLGTTTPAPTPDELAETTLTGFLLSPSFLMLPELATDRQLAPNIELSNYEVATRLSMLLWNSIPDDDLALAADRNELQTKDQILAQAKRMLLDHGKSAPVMSAFHQRWSRADDDASHWWKTNHDTSRFPAYNAKAATAEQAEIEAFFDDVAFGHGTFKDYFLSNVAFVSRDNAPIYGLDATRYGAELERVELDATQRPGFLSRAGFLSSYSLYDRTNPFTRGAFIARDLLGIQVPPPSPEFIDRLVTTEGATERAHAEGRTHDDTCKPCHSIINPYGFALENYDAIGAWQTVDPRGGKIDATATVLLGDGSSTAIDSPLQLMQELARSPYAKRVYAQSWVSFAFNRAPNAADECVVDNLAGRLASDGYQILDVLPELTQTDAFRMRVRGTP
ncbi:MAG TPA: DUF1592 domain-containing protein [Polyangiaceae bacterium]|nr:DUF1592 domain-containing protein [Polyangiaceae bacterium]